MSNSGPSTSSGRTEVKPLILEEKLQRSKLFIDERGFQEVLKHLSARRVGSLFCEDQSV